MAASVVVLVLLAGIFAAIRLPVWRREWRAFKDACSLRASVVQVHDRTGEWPPTLKDIFKRDEQGQYAPGIEQLFDDPWGHPYHYERPSDATSTPRVWSFGRDGTPGGSGEDADIEAIGPLR